jgi:hypothetical protein
MADNFQSFLKYAYGYAEKNNKEIEIRDVKYLNNSGKCLGFCDGERMVVSKNNDYFQETFCHEFCHLMQVVSGSELWSKFDPIFFQIDLSKKGIVEYWPSLLSVMELERDCELRTVELSKKFSLFNEETLIKTANVHLALHHLAFLKGKWFSPKKAFEKEILDIMPDRVFSKRGLEKIDMKLIKQLEK